LQRCSEDSIRTILAWLFPKFERSVARKLLDYLNQSIHRPAPDLATKNDRKSKDLYQNLGRLSNPMPETELFSSRILGIALLAATTELAIDDAGNTYPSYQRIDDADA